MDTEQGILTVSSVETPSGRISYVAAGSGPVALFVHGVLLNKHLWGRQIGRARRHDADEHYTQLVPILLGVSLACFGGAMWNRRLRRGV